jgi:hypothetical protein
MFARLCLLPLALAAATCSAEPGARNESQPEPSLPSIPAALHGCWELRQAPDEEYPDGLSEVLTVKADRIIIDAKGVDRQVGTIEQVQRLTPTLIEGRIAGRDEHGPYTMATTLELDPQGAPAGTLLLREGDAGSYDFTRCSPATATAQRFSLVIAESGHQDDPRPAPCGPDGNCGDFLYRSEFRGARVIAGGELPARFEARLKLHTPYISNYVLALIVERLKDGTLLVRRQAGFNGRNGIACFNDPGEWPVDWRPEQAASVRWERGDLCVFEKSQIDPNAPKD